MRKPTYVFVHGLSGWGSYDDQYRRMPYWGMRNGDLMEYLRKEGFSCYAASVAPRGSAWDRACELYAQIAGVRTDYGLAHSRRYNHERYGPDFTGRSLIPQWNKDTRLVLLGHSFGGATIRVCAGLLAYGDPEEQEETPADELSPLFAGGMQERLFALVTLAAPTNGTTAYDLFEDTSFDPDSVRVSPLSRILARMMSMGTQPERDGRDPRDYADWDMHIDEALRLNERFPTLPDVLQFAVPCSSTIRQADSTWIPDPKKTEGMFLMRAAQIGAYTGYTKEGMFIGEEWRQNDGLVNTFSAGAPLGAPAVPLDREHIEPGVWNVFPVYDGDHMSLQGGMTKKHDVRGFYNGLLEMISQCAEKRKKDERNTDQ